MRAFVLAALTAYATASKQPSGSTDSVLAVTDATGVSSDEMPPMFDEPNTTGVDTTATTETNTVNVQESTADDEDYSTQEATDFKDNADSKEEMEAFSWTTYHMDDFKFGDLMDLLESDQEVATLAGEVRVNFMEYYDVKVADLPEVCAAGKQCRADIKTEARQQVLVEWETAMAAIRTEIENTLLLTRKELESSYQAAYLCDHGCGCEFIENQYTFIKAEIEQIDKNILERQGQIDGLMIQIAEADQAPCDFSEIEAKYDDIWEDMEEDHEKQIDALADWKNDDYEMQDFVDQEAFEEKYGFKYESSRFDKWDNGMLVEDL